MTDVPCKAIIDLGEGKVSIAAVVADGVPAILFQRLREQKKIGDGVNDEDVTDTCNVLIRIHNEAGFCQLQKIMKHIEVDIDYMEDERAQQAIDKANKGQEEEG